MKTLVGAPCPVSPRGLPSPSWRGAAGCHGRLCSFVLTIIMDIDLQHESRQHRSRTSTSLSGSPMEMSFWRPIRSSSKSTRASFHRTPPVFRDMFKLPNVDEGQSNAWDNTESYTRGLPLVTLVGDKRERCCPRTADHLRTQVSSRLTSVICLIDPSSSSKSYYGPLRRQYTSGNPS